ncbi:MAG: archease [Candidatus Omnitrophica bacterium]|nr:archease [Candidatus Omnitrophota bacterium]
MIGKNYELIEHTADIGIRVKGKDLKEVFKNTALAMFDIIAEKRTDNREQITEKIMIKQKADNLDELFINWLNELLSLSATKEKIFCEFNFKNLDENNLEAEVGGCDIRDYKVNTEIKAATYHQLKLAQISSGWQAEVILDV